MFCENCGTRLASDEKYCPNCGNEIKKNNIVTSQSKTESNGKKTASIVLGIISLAGIFFVVFSPISLILSLIGLIIGIKAHKETSNVAGIVLNAIGLFISVIITAIIAFIIMIIVNVRKNVDISDFKWNEIANKIDIESRF